MREILFFSENKVVLLMYKQNESGLINNNKSDMRYDSFFFHPHSKQANTPMEVPVWSENEKEEVITTKLSIRVLIYNVLIILH